MKINFKLQLVLVFILTIVHNVLFWNQYFGVNTLVFTGVIISVLAIIKTERFKNVYVVSSICGVFFSSIMVVLHGSSVAKFAYVTSFTIFIGFLNAETLRNFFYTFVAVIERFAILPALYENEFKSLLKSDNSSSNSYKRKLKLSLIPLVALLVFYWLFKFANPVFDKITADFGAYIAKQIGFIFQDISFGRLFFALLGFVIASMLIIKNHPLNIVLFENKQSDILSRNRKPREALNLSQAVFKMLALKNEYQSGLLMLGLINVLLLFVNAIDINWIWFNFDPKSVSNLSQFVHEGTYLLIASILLSMGIMEFLFRKNLNFYPKNEWLRRLCYVWILQNVILVISVGLRNYHYISEHGLAYKRIGVVFFLMLTLYGLITQFIKIKMVKSAYFLMRVNSWSFYIVMLLLAAFNWDIIITKHNLSHPKKENIDLSFLLDMSPKTLPIMLEYAKENKLEQFQRDILEDKKRFFIQDYESRTYLSWNYADQKAYEFLNTK